jgi:hypothetical protein
MFIMRFECIWTYFHVKTSVWIIFMDLVLNESYLCLDVKTFVWTYFCMDNIYCVMCDFPV